MEPPKQDDSTEQLLANLLSEGDVKHWRVIGVALEALIRMTRSSDVLVPGLARRVIDNWFPHLPSRLVFRPTEVYMGDKVALAAEEDTGTWILPAYTAGLRGIRLTDDVEPGDLASLAEDLGALRMRDKSLSEFHDWLWASGVQGIELEVTESLVDGLETLVDAEVIQRAVPKRRSAVAVDEWNQRARGVLGSLPEDELRARFQHPMLDLSEVAADEFHVSKEEAGGLRADGTVVWIRAEMEALLMHPELRRTLPGSRLGKRLLAYVEAAQYVDRRLLTLLLHLAKDRSRTGRALLKDLSTEDFGLALGEHMLLEDVDTDLLGDVLDSLRIAAERGLLYNLLRRAMGEGLALQAIVALVQRWGLSRFLEKVESAWIEVPVAIGIVKAVSDAGTDPAELANFIGGMPPQVAAQVLGTMNVLSEPLKPTLRQLLTRHPADCGALIQSLLSQGEFGISLVGESLLVRKGRGWKRRILKLAFPAMLSADAGRTALAKLIQSRETELAIRKLALDAVEVGAPDLCLELTRWRVAELGESAEFRQYLQEARKRLKQA